MRRKIVAGNWKMNGDKSFANSFSSEFQKKSSGVSLNCDVIIAPPAPLLSIVSDGFEGSEVSLSAQNVAAYEGGAYTGEVSASMVQDFGCAYSLVGHSERRTLFGDTDEVVAEKIGQLLTQGIAPILCVGETLAERDAGKAKDVVGAQVAYILDRFSESQLESLVVAYEPVWAIGTGRTASPQQAQEMHAYIRAVLSTYSVDMAQSMTVLYGGSVNSKTAQELFAQQDIDGGLVGGASLKVDEFFAICQSFG